MKGRTFPVEQIFLEEAVKLSGYVMGSLLYISYYKIHLTLFSFWCLEPDSQFSRKISKKDEEDLMQELEYVDIKANLVPPSKSIRDENLSLSNLLSR